MNAKSLWWTSLATNRALDEATAKRWTVVDMKNDWRTIF